MTIGRLAALRRQRRDDPLLQRRRLVDEHAKPANATALAALGRWCGSLSSAACSALGVFPAEVQHLLKYADGPNWRETRQIAERKLESLKPAFGHAGQDAPRPQALMTSR